MDDVLKESRQMFDVSSVSVEGVGGLPGCASREVELENRVSELSFRLAGLARERGELREAGSPAALLQDRGSLFHGMARSAGLVAGHQTPDI